ncbi:MAG: hypothetical protein WCD11_03945 [Solirubrobacteraceae bacterium]
MRGIGDDRSRGTASALEPLEEDAAARFQVVAPQDISAVLLLDDLGNNRPNERRELDGRKRAMWSQFKE